MKVEAQNLKKMECNRKLIPFTKKFTNNLTGILNHKRNITVINTEKIVPLPPQELRSPIRCHVRFFLLTFCSKKRKEEVSKLVEFLQTNKKISVLTGAGIR